MRGWSFRVDETVQESGFGGRRVRSGKEAAELGMHDEGGHGELGKQDVKNVGLGHAVVVLAGEVGFHDD